MKRAYLFFILLLSSCVPAGGATTPDLFMQAQSARSTADAAQDLAQFQGEQLTATAEAPIMRITETAAGLIVQQTQGSIDKTSTAALWTATNTPIPTITLTATPNATSTKMFVVLAAESTQIANNVERDNLDLEKKRISNDFFATVSGLSWAFLALVGILLLMVAVRLKRYQPAQVDARGNVLPLIDVVEGTITDTDSNPNYRGDTRDNMIKQWLRLKLNLPPLLPEVTAERQDAVKQRDQLTDMATRGLPHDPTQRERKKLAGQEAMKQLGAPTMQSRFKILDGENSNLEVIDGEIIKELDQAWKETE